MEGEDITASRYVGLRATFRIIALFGITKGAGSELHVCMYSYVCMCVCMYLYHRIQIKKGGNSNESFG